MTQLDVIESAITKTLSHGQRVRLLAWLKPVIEHECEQRFRDPGGCSSCRECDKLRPDQPDCGNPSSQRQADTAGNTTPS